MNIKTKTIPIDIRVRIFVMLALVSAISLGLYFYAVLATVHHALAKESLTLEKATLSVRVSELEYESLGMRNEVGLDVALSKGFTEVKNPLYVSRLAPSLTLHTEER